MKKILICVAFASALSGCAVARTAGNVAVGTGQAALGVVDMAI